MKKFLFLLNLVCFAAILMTPAYAYLDPSVMTYTVQIIAGVVITIGAVIGIYWRRAKKKVKDTLGIDENANKEVEEDVVEFTDAPAETKDETVHQ